MSVSVEVEEFAKRIYSLFYLWNTALSLSHSRLQRLAPCKCQHLHTRMGRIYKMDKYSSLRLSQLNGLLHELNNAAQLAFVGLFVKQHFLCLLNVVEQLGVGVGHGSTFI